MFFNTCNHGNFVEINKNNTDVSSFIVRFFRVWKIHLKSEFIRII